MRIPRNNLWLLFPLAVTALGDGVLTLLGNDITGNAWGWEISPLWRWFLERGALAFGVAFAVYLVSVGAIVACAPLRVARVVCVTMVLAHTWGVVSWLHAVGVGYALWPLVYVTIAVVTVVALERSGGAGLR